MTTTISNPRRGCGHLQRDKVYLRGVLSEDGILPSFVRIDPPVPYREIGTEGQFTRSYERFDGLTFELATVGKPYDYVPLSPGRKPYTEVVKDTILDKTGLYPDKAHIPNDEVFRHLDRVELRGVAHEGDDWGDHPAAGHNDLLMRAGGSYYPEPEDFIDEAKELGLSKAIPVSPNRDPPNIWTGVTKCWIMHPNASPVGSTGGGIIGYAYISESVYTQPEDGTVPSYIEDLDDTDHLDVVDIEPPQDPIDENQSSVGDFDSSDTNDQ